MAESDRDPAAPGQGTPATGGQPVPAGPTGSRGQAASAGPTGSRGQPATAGSREAPSAAAPGQGPAGAARDGTPGGEQGGVEPRRPRNWIPYIAGAVALAALAYFGWHWWKGRDYASTNDAHVGGDIVPVLARVSGYVRQVLVHENESVRAGQPLVLIDEDELRQQLASARARLAMAQQAAGTTSAQGQVQAQAAAARAGAAAARAGVAQAEANEARARRQVERLTPLADQGIVSREQFDQARTAYAAAQAALRMARQQAAAAQEQAQAAGVGETSAGEQVREARAALAQAELQLSYARVTAPEAGVIAQKSVEPGQLVGPGQALMAVVLLSSVWVTANLKETQLQGVEPGAPAEISVDAYDGLRFHGRVESISPATSAQFSLLPAENATGNFTKVVQRVPVRIRLDTTGNPSAPLRPGMSVEVRIRRTGTPPPAPARQPAATAPAAGAPAARPAGAPAAAARRP